MKPIQTIMILCVLLVGCTTTEVQESTPGGQVTFSEGTNKYCALTAYNKDDGKFLMVDKLFSEMIPCSSNDDCVQYLLEQDDYRSLAPEFEPYLSCEEMDASPVQKA